MTYEEMARAYGETAGAHEYAVGFEFEKELYVIRVTFEKLSAFFKNDRASSNRGGFKKIRIRLTSAQRKELAATAEKLGNYDELIKVKDGWNGGEHFERILTERWTGETWEKDSKPYYECGDINLNGVEIQIKLDGAELTNEKVIGNRLAALAAA